MLQRVPAVLTVIFVLLLGHAVLALAQAFAVGGAAPASSGPEAPARTATPIQRAEQPPAERIAAWHLFGTVQAGRKVTRAPTVAPDTQLRLTLFGVAAGIDGRSAARAIIAGPDGIEQTYGPGDALPGGAELKEIYPDRVILVRNERYETLRLPKEQLRLGAGTP